MPPFGPLKRRELMAYLKLLDFHGPYSGGKHQYLVRGSLKLFIPNPHSGEISAELLARILRQAGVSRTEWEAL